jgi:coproporphyrinogen III oxidase
VKLQYNSPFLCDMFTKEQIAERFRLLQDDICRQLEDADGGGVFQEDLWQHHEGGGGRSRVIAGKTIEKGGVNFSAVTGMLPEVIASNMGIPRTTFFATGVSIVLHPHSPMAPIIHMNVRYFEAGGNRWWFGGGIDLTPHYVVPEDAHYFHSQLKTVCDGFHPEFYATFKKQADDYFFIKHRDETRGIGGIFFDYQDELKNRVAARAAFRICRCRWRNFCANVCRTAAPGKRPAMGRARKKLADAAQGALCGVQPGMGPGHQVRTRNRRTHRKYPDEYAARGTLGL